MSWMQWLAPVRTVAPKQKGNMPDGKHKKLRGPERLPQAMRLERLIRNHIGTFTQRTVSESGICRTQKA